MNQKAGNRTSLGVLALLLVILVFLIWTIFRHSALLGRIDALTGDIENAWFATRKKMDDLGLPPLLRLLRWMPGPAGKLPFPFGILVRALGSGLRAFRGVWKSRDKNGTASGRKESSP